MWCEDFSICGTAPYSEHNALIVFTPKGHKNWGGTDTMDFMVQETEFTIANVYPDSNTFSAGPTRLLTFEDQERESDKPNIVCTISWRPSYYTGSYQVKVPEWFVDLYVRRWSKTVNFKLSLTFTFTTGNEHYDERQDQVWSVTVDTGSFIKNAINRWSRAYNHARAYSWVFDIVGTTVTSVKFPDALVIVQYKIPWAISDSQSDHNVMLGVGLSCESFDIVRGKGPRGNQTLQAWDDALDETDDSVDSFELV